MKRSIAFAFFATNILTGAATRLKELVISQASATISSWATAWWLGPGRATAARRSFGAESHQSLERMGCRFPTAIQVKNKRR